MNHKQILKELKYLNEAEDLEESHFRTSIVNMTIEILKDKLKNNGLIYDQLSRLILTSKDKESTCKILKNENTKIKNAIELLDMKLGCL